MRFPPDRRRLEVEHVPEGARITILPQRRRPVAVLWGIVWFGWFAGMIAMITIGDPPPLGLILLAPFILGMLALGTLSGVFSVGWELAGREVVLVMTQGMVRKLSIGRVTFHTRRFALAGMSRFRIPLEHGSYFAEAQWAWPMGQGGGTVNFDYYGQREHLGARLKVGEAEALLDELAKLGPRFQRAAS